MLLLGKKRSLPVLFCPLLWPRASELTNGRGNRVSLIHCPTRPYFSLTLCAARRYNAVKDLYIYAIVAYLPTMLWRVEEKHT